MTKQEFLQVAEWIADGVCEWKLPFGGWSSHPDYVSSISIDDLFSNYRRKPQPKYRPWKPEEVPVGCLISDGLTEFVTPTISLLIATRGVWCTIIHAHKATLHEVTPKELFEKFKHSLDHGKTWKPCGVEE